MDVRAEYMDTPRRRVLDLRREGLSEIPMLGWYSYSRARPDLPVHRHAGGLEVCYLERGNQVFEVSGQQYRLSGGDVFVTFPDEPHSTGGNPSEPGILYWINVRLPKRGNSLFALPRSESTSLVQALQGLPYRHFRATRQTKELFDELFKLHARPEVVLRASRMRCAAIRLLVEIIDGAARRAAVRTSKRMAEIIEWILANPSASFRLDELARRAGLSVSHFKKRFKAEAGLSPWQFILRSKIETAKQWLKTSEASITDVALDLGFASSQYFATVFKRMAGVTPTAYRRSPIVRSPSTRTDDGQT